MAVVVAAPVEIGLDAEAGRGGAGAGAGGEVPLEVAGNEVLPPVEVGGEGVPPPVEVDEKGPPPVEGVPVAVTARGEKEKEGKGKGEGVKWLGHYSSAQDILLVGDGDFSFSLALATAFGSGTNLVATSLDTYEDLKDKYSKAESNLTELKRLGATLMHGVDTKKMKLHPDLKNRKFDRIIFNLPHAGFKGKEDDLHMINSHRELVWGFFNNALHLFRPYCEIHISHKTGGAYDRWELEDLASEASLVLVDKVAF
ncbi:heavy metal-associated isoprenylated plant protein 41-like isoform X1 [Panicum virgatum]|uniref:heavy metal-associated isoprenylated plant protein 41-like isoform X1 n=1 Tax=Panicum virgatum TaxID=38727 RepID=UPI0019D5A9BD|nr:heavy metal-associated isoprenylated plant protein 41-like isoform X1 [Panicum virgatum]